MDSSYEPNTIFNNAQSKKTYLKLVTVHFSTSLFREKRSTIHQIKNIDKKRIELLNLKLKIKGRDRYELIERNNKSVLNFIDKHCIREVLSFDGIYDLLIKSHIENDGHEINDYLKTALVNKYLIPSICFDLIPEACNICKEKKEKGCGASKTGYVSFIHNMKLNKVAYYNSVLIYLDEYTEYMILRPTKSFDEMDMTTELFKIFMNFGPPEKVYINLKESHITNSVSNMMHNLCPSCKIIYRFNNLAQQEVSMRVMEGIGAWMDKTKSNSWEIGCSIVQHSINKQVKRVLPSNIPISAHDLFFNNSILDLVNTDSSSEIVDSDDEPLVFIKKKNTIMNEEDPLASDIKNLNIQEESYQRKSRRVKNIKQHQDEDPMLAEIDLEIAKEQVKSKKNKNKVKRPVRNTSDDKLLDDDLRYTIEDEPMRTSREVIESKVKMQTTKSSVDKKDTNTDERSTGLNEKLDAVITDIVEAPDEDNETASTSASVVGNEGNLDDDDDVDIDFGAEI